MFKLSLSSQSFIDSSHDARSNALGLVVSKRLILLTIFFCSTKLLLNHKIAVCVKPLRDLWRDWTTKSALDLTADLGNPQSSQKRKYAPCASSTKTGIPFWWQISTRGSMSVAYPW